MRDFWRESEEKKRSERDNYGVVRDEVNRLEQWGDFVLLMMFFVSAYIIDRLIEHV